MTFGKYPAMMPAVREHPILDRVRREIDSSGMTRYRIAKEAKLSESLLSRFMAHERGLNLDALDRLGKLLGFKLVLQWKAR